MRKIEGIVTDINEELEYLRRRESRFAGPTARLGDIRVICIAFGEGNNILAPCLRSLLCALSFSTLVTLCCLCHPSPCPAYPVYNHRVAGPALASSPRPAGR